MMTDDEFKEVERQIKEARLSADQTKTHQIQDSLYNPQEKSMISEQLDLGSELDRIDYLLRGFTLKRNKETGESYWDEPDDPDMVILSEYGIHLIRNTIAWYMNKNTLLSNYDEATINKKMFDFANDLNDTIFMEYEKVFQYPTLEQCKTVLNERLRQKRELKIYALEVIRRENLDDKEKEKIEQEILKQVEPIIEKELTKIKEQIIKSKLKRFLLLVREVQDAVHSTYLRAWKGQERTTLRQHIHISETKGGLMPQQNHSPNPFSFLGRKK